ncbi:hypothetical protein B0H12DRAFT_1118743, partial [Mycena haematopus]
MSASEAPVLLGHICSSWRAISLSTPRLWASLHVVEPVPGPPHLATTAFDQKVVQRLEITKTWLGRSGHCPLSISLHCAPEITSGVGAITVSATSIEFLQTVVSFAPRWQHVHFTTPPSLLFEVMSFIDANIPALETVAFHHQAHRPLDAISCGPFNMLRGARISSFSVPGSIFTPGDFPLRWNQLTTLTVGGPPWNVPPTLTSDVLLRVISECPELRCCKLMVHDPTSEILILPRPIVELPFLHTLAIHCIACVTTAVSVLLLRLSLPELRNLTILGRIQD